MKFQGSETKIFARENIFRSVHDILARLSGFLG
jgi:hypothetical protein